MAKGNDYSAKNLASEAAPIAQEFNVGEFKQGSSNVSDQFKDYLNFLSTQPLMLFNLKASKDGKVSFTIPES